LEKWKDLVHDYSDLFIALLIVTTMGLVVYFNLVSLFDEDRMVVAQPEAPHQEDQAEQASEEEPTLMIDLEETEEMAEQEEEEPETPEPRDQAEDTEPVSITISPGTAGSQIGDLLVEKGLLNETESFIQAAEELGLSNRLRSGTYHIPPDASAEEMVRIISGQS